MGVRFDGNGTIEMLVGSSAGWYHLSITMSCIYSGLWYKKFTIVCKCVCFCVEYRFASTDLGIIVIGGGVPLIA